MRLTSLIAPVLAILAWTSVAAAETPADHPLEDYELLHSGPFRASAHDISVDLPPIHCSPRTGQVSSPRA